MEKTGYAITHQPVSQAHMSSSSPPPLPSAPSSSRCSKNKCHAHRLRRLLPALIALLTLIAISAWLLCPDMSEVALDVGSSLWKRQSSTSGTSEDSPFVKNKLYLIVIFVGLLVIPCVARVISVLAAVGSPAWNASDVDSAVKVSTK
ncbi:hypothetical protein BDV93DRAFT_601906 [Ceratobasidium sp. AG-I]|nr:hypothetical protein BDV93DRAFT_601906 [Ceratobasidium sp. AG-I]